jgi:hypothetical protein
MDFSAARSEIAMARKARSEGNEGRARVCSRRASGFAVREYLLQHHHLETGLTLSALLTDVSVRLKVPSECTMYLDHMILRVNEDYQLPDGIDLIEDAENLIKLLTQIDGEKND